jgi:hypothetical protein
VLGQEAIASPEQGDDAKLNEADSALAHSLIQYIRKKIASDNVEQIENLERQHQLQLASEKNKLSDELRELEQLHSDQLRQMQVEITKLQEANENEKQGSETLRRQLLEQQQISEKLRESFHDQLAETKQVEGNQIELLKSNFESELSLRIQAIAKEYEQQLDGKDIEIAYKNEQQSLLREEIAQLHEEHAQLIKEAGEQFISRLRDNKVTFMAYHLGAGNITIDLDSIGVYLENPIAYASNICKVPESDYRAWISHYSNPACCEFSAAKGETCGKKLRRVETPTQFVSGRSDRCPLHWTFTAESPT